MRRIFYDDFTAYASTAEVQAAYPYDPPADTSTNLSGNVEFGATYGPGSVPGVRATGSGGRIEAFPLGIEGRKFKIAAKYDFSYYTVSGPDPGPNSTVSLINNWWAPEGGHRDDDFAGNMVQITRYAGTDAIAVTVKTTPAYANSITPNNLYGDTFTGVLPASGIFDIVIDGQRSSITETSPGVWAPDADGYIRVSVNGSQIFSFDGPVWHGTDTINQLPYWNGVTWKAMGLLTNLEVWDDPSEPPVDDAHVCSCTSTDPGVPTSGGGTGNGATPNQTPTIGAVIGCIGGGLVPTQADVTPSELWWAA